MQWSRLASAYDWQLPLERPALAAAVTLAAPRTDDVWLDVGTGTGGLLRQLARHDRRPRRVIGVDASAAMLASARAPCEGWSLEVADGRRLPFEDDAFSVVSVAYLLHVVDAPDRRQIIRECRRVLRADGRLVVVTPAWPRARLARMLYAPLTAGARVGPGAAFRPLDPRDHLREQAFDVSAARYIARGYPSLCVAARRATGAGGAHGEAERLRPADPIAPRSAHARSSARRSPPPRPAACGDQPA